MNCCNKPCVPQPPLPPSAMGVNPPPYPGPAAGKPCAPCLPPLPPLPPVPPTCNLPCDQAVFRRVLFPASMGDDKTVPPSTLEYRNVILEYEFNSHVYIYSSDGVPTLISNGTGTNFNDLTNRPLYNNEVMTGLTNIPQVPTKIADLSDAARITCIETNNQTLMTEYENINNTVINLSKTVNGKQDTLVSGTNLKTINGETLLGSGNLEITLDSAGVQPLLVSGENIKTVNGQDILGAGNLQIDVPEVDLSDYYTKEEVNDELDTKQNTLVSGTSIKTINGTSLLGAGDIEVTVDGYTKTEADALLADKQDTLVSGTNIKTVNGETLLGSGNIVLSTPKLYNAYGANTDGSLTQEFATTKLQALETADTTINTTIEGIDGRLETAENTITELQDYADKTVQTDTKLGTDLSSTVTLIKTTDSLAASQPTDTEIPLPVASESQAGVISPDTFKQIQDNASKIAILLSNTVLDPTLPANPTSDQIGEAYKAITGVDTIPNGARITGSDGVTYVYYANENTWVKSADTGGTIDVKPFTNTAAGTIKGSDVDGKVFAESDGTGSVKGWDAAKADIANNTTAIETAQSDLTALTTRVDTAETNITAVTTTADNAATAVTNLTTQLAETNAKVAALEQPATPSETVEGQDGLSGIDTTGFTGGETVEVKNDANNGGKDSIYTWDATEGQWVLKGDASPYALSSDLDNLTATVDTNVSDISGLKTRMTTTEGTVATQGTSIASNTANIATNTTAISDLNTRMTDAETSIAANTALIGDVDTLLQTLDTGTGV